jgi:hypothetical protein
MRDKSAMEEVMDFDCCFEALKKASAILTILKSESCSVNEIKPIDQTQAAFDRSLAAKEASAKERQAKEDAAIAAREADAPKEKDAPAEDNPATKPKGRKPKASEDVATEDKAMGETPPPADAPAKPKINEILWWDGENQDHRKVLIMILKEDHGWDSKTPENIALASLVKTELQKCEIDHTRQDLIRAKVGEIVADLKAVLAQTKEAKAPF